MGEELSISVGFHWVDNGQIWLGQLTCRIELNTIEQCLFVMHTVRSFPVMHTNAATAPHWPCSAKREKSRLESESSSWQAAKVKTKCSRKRPGHSCEHRIFHVTKLKALETSSGHRGSSGVRGDHFDSALNCVMTWTNSEISPHEGKNMHRGRQAARAWFKERESSGSAEDGGEECSLGQCLLSLQERGGADPLQRRTLHWFDWTSPVSRLVTKSCTSATSSIRDNLLPFQVTVEQIT